MPTNLFDESTWGARELTDAIMEAPLHPQLLRDLALFEMDGIRTTKALIEYRNGVVGLIPHTPRGAPAPVHQRSGRSMLEVDTAHFATRDTVYADSALDVRAFGSTAVQSPETIRDERLSDMANNLWQGIEHQQMGAIKGLVTDAEGTVLLDTYAEFGQAQQSVDLDLATGTTKVATKIVSAIRLSERALGGTVRPRGFAIFAAPDIMDGLRDHPSLAAAVQASEAQAILNSDHRAGDLVISGVKCFEYANPEDGTVYVPAGEAYLVPLGVPKLFRMYFAPADYVEAVGTEGQPLYAKSEVGPLGKYLTLEAQSNPISLCTRPRAVIRLTA